MQNGSRPTAGLPDDAHEAALGDFVVDGEFVALTESLVIAPTRGRFRREALVEGSAIEAGARIGAVAYNGGVPREVCSPRTGVFLGWMAWEGEFVDKGAMLARIGPVPTPIGDGAAATPARENGSRGAKR